MLMNRVETWTMNNPVRAAVQTWVEASWLLHLGGRLDGGEALELGCGRGEGLRIILERFGARRAVGIDLDPAQVARARRRLGTKHGDAAEAQEGDVARLEFPEASFDAVFDFGILHHCAEWRQALREVHRVLKPGGRFYFEEVLQGFLETRLARGLFRHPAEGHFTAHEFALACEDAGFKLLRPMTELGPYFTLGVAVRLDVPTPVPAPAAAG